MSKNSNKINMNKDEKYLFDKSIQARYEHIHFYNHWMNMYAIFNGALFVCLYTLAKECKCWDKNLFLFLEILTSLLGVIAGWCWHFSAKGFYDWLLSYIKNTNEHENNLKIQGKDKVFNIFYGKFKAKKLKNPYSTQKLTQCFTLFVALAWSIVLVLKFWSCLKIKTDCIENIQKTVFQYINHISFLHLLPITLAILSLLIFSIHKYCKENLEEDGLSTFDIKK